MGSERIKVEKHIKDCNNGWCDRCEGGKGHNMKYSYNSIVDISTIDLDGQRIIAPDGIIDALAQMVVDANEEAVK